MAGNFQQKDKIIVLLKILTKHTDEQHPLNASELSKLLLKQGITAERKSIYSDIAVLTNNGYDIKTVSKPKSGYYLDAREFETPEIFLLCDAVESADFITPKKTYELISKLEGLISENQAKQVSSQVFVNKNTKCKNEEIYDIIYNLSNAVSQMKTVTFEYGKKVMQNGKPVVICKERTVSPYALVWVNDHYYLIGNISKYDNLAHFRLDRISKVAVNNEEARHYSEVSEYKDRFDVSDYVNKSFNMYGGELCSIKLRCDETILNQCSDKFGENVYIRPDFDNKGYFILDSKAMVSEGLIGWILQFGEKIEVISPLTLREKISDNIKKLYKLYKS